MCERKRAVPVRYFRWLVRACIGLGLLTLGASYLGALHGLGDSLAMFRDWITYGVLGLGVFALFVRTWWGGVVSLVAGLAATLHLLSFQTLHTPAPVSAPDLVVYVKNLAWRWGDVDAVVQDIERADADVILLQELSPDSISILTGLLPDHPYHHICAFSDWSAMAVLSRYPLSAPGCTDYRSLAYAVVDAPGGPVWTASIHQVWPYPYQQPALLPDILAAIPPPGTRQVIAGDFNMVPWGHSVRAIMDAGGTRRISPALDTIEVRGVGFPIDHVLTDGDGTATLRGRMGSDHEGLVARIVWGD